MIPTIYKTTDYKLFRYHDSNREVTYNKNLYDSIKKNNLLEYNPIIIDNDLKIIDGQHRLAIAKLLKVPIYYVIAPNIDDSAISYLNSSQKNWTLENYIHHFSKKNRVAYVFLQQKVIPVKSQLSIFEFSRIFAKGDSKNLKNGTLFFAYSYDKLERYVDFYMQLIQLCINLNCFRRPPKKVQQVLFRIIKHENYDHEHFLKKIDRYPEKVAIAAKYNLVSEIKRLLLDELYNHKKIKNKITLQV